LCNFSEKKVNYNREFSSDFQNGECWGYNRFYKIDNMEKEGYIDPITGKIKLKFYVRPQTYTQLCRDQRNYILSLEKKVLDSQQLNVNAKTLLNTNQNYNNINTLNQPQSTGDIHNNNFLGELIAPLKVVKKFILNYKGRPKY